MKPQKQVCPSVSITLLENGLLRLEDESFSEGAIVDLHPIHCQLLAAMIGRPVPDRTRAHLAKLHTRIDALCERSRELERMLADALTSGQHVGLELHSAEHLAERLADLAQDLGELVEAPEIGEPVAEVGQGGQMTLAHV
jgi:hypothetical protein